MRGSDDIALTDTAVCIDARPGGETTFTVRAGHLTEGKEYEVLGGLRSRFLIVDDDKGGHTGYASRRFAFVPRNGDVLAVGEMRA
jgi:hypothetical protein